MLYAVTCVQVESLGEGDTVVLYLHGNSFNRSQSHRLGLYSLLLKLGYHVLAIGRVFRLIEKVVLKPLVSLKMRPFRNFS
jgi:hypothetical protein